MILDYYERQVCACVWQYVAVRVLNCGVCATRQVDSMLETVQELNRAIETRDNRKLKSQRLHSALTRVNDISIQVIMSGLRNKYVPHAES